MSKQALIEALRILADFPIDEFAMASKPDSYAIFRSNDWQLKLGHVRAARRAIASCQPVPVSPSPPMESLGRNGNPTREVLDTIHPRNTDD